MMTTNKAECVTKSGFRVVQLPDGTIPIDCRERLVERLEDYLAQARAGCIAGIAIAIVRPDGSVTHWWNRLLGVSRYTILGAMDSVRHMILDDIHCNDN